MNFNELDALVTSVGMPVRLQTLTGAWDMTEPAERRGRVIVLVTLRAKSGQVSALVAASREFVNETVRLAGSLGSTLHRSRADPDTVYLLERFAGEEPFARHMASDYFATFQRAQVELLAEPVTATFLERGT